MTDRVLGKPGPERRRRMRLLPLALLLAAGMLVVVTAASGAFFPPNPSDPDAAAYAITVDENGPNDVPGQKDLTLHGLDESGLPNQLKVLWDWDEISISGNNTLDACSLLTSDANIFADYALCLTLGGQPLAPLATTLYSCGDTRVDRCASQIAVVVLPANASTSCSFAVTNNTDPFPGPASKAKGTAYPQDTRAKCTLDLPEIAGATGVPVADLDLINTCSYPSQQPNSDPSDCVLIPRDATLIIVKDADDDTTAFPFTVTGGGTFSGNVSDGSPQTVGIVSGVNTTVAEGTEPTGWAFTSASCTGSTLTGGNGTPGKSITVKAATGNTITCTFVNDLQLGSIDVSKTSSDSGSQEGAVFTLYSGTDTTGTVVGTCTVDAGGHCDSDDASYDNPSFDDLVAGNYTLDETTVPAGYDKDADLPKTDIVLGAGQDLTFSFENVAQPGSVSISKTDDAGDPLAGVTFQLYEDDNGTPGDAISGASCTTDNTGACAIQNVVAGTYCLDETNLPSGYDPDPDLPECGIAVTLGGSVNRSYENDRLFKVITIVCKKAGSELYPSSVTYDSGSAQTSLAASGLGTVDEEDLCGLGGAVHDDVGTGSHTSSINIPTSQP